jgi:hypothetical protein
MLKRMFFFWFLRKIFREITIAKTLAPELLQIYVTRMQATSRKIFKYSQAVDTLSLIYLKILYLNQASYVQY